MTATGPALMPAPGISNRRIILEVFSHWTGTHDIPPWIQAAIADELIRELQLPSHQSKDDS